MKPLFDVPALSRPSWWIWLAMAALSGPASAQSGLKCGLSNGQKATGKPIPVGALVGKTGPDDFSAAAAAAAAYFKCVNDNGGIRGRPVDYVVVDDQWDLKMAAQGAEELLNRRKVVAMVGSSSFVECGVNAQRYAEEGILSIAGTGVQRECFHAKAYVPLNTGPRISGIIAAMQAVKLAAVSTAQEPKGHAVSKMACLIPNIPGLGDWACGGLQAWGSKRGIKVEVIAIDLGTFSARDVMTKAAAGRPDVILMNFPKGILLPMMAAAQQLDLAKGIRFVSSAPAYSADVANALGPYWKDRFFANLEFMPVEHDGPDTRNWLAVMDKYALKTDSRDSFSQSGYLAARLFTQAALLIEPTQLDRASLSAGLHRVTNFMSDMLCKPFYVGNGKRHNANHSGPIAVFTGKAWAPLPGGECITAEDPALQDVLTDERKITLRR